MKLPWAQGCETVSLLPTGPYLLCGGRDGGLRLFDLRMGRVLKDLAGHDMAIKGMAVRGNGATFATGSLDGNLQLCRADKLDVVATWPEAHTKTSFLTQGGKSFGVTGLDVGAASGALFSCGGDGTVKCCWPGSL